MTDDSQESVVSRRADACGLRTAPCSLSGTKLPYASDTCEQLEQSVEFDPCVDRCRHGSRQLRRTPLSNRLPLLICALTQPIAAPAISDSFLCCLRVFRFPCTLDKKDWEHAGKRHKRASSSTRVSEMVRSDASHEGGCSRRCLVPSGQPFRPLTRCRAS